MATHDTVTTTGSVSFNLQSFLVFAVWLAVAGRPLEGSDVALVLSDWALAVSGRVLESFFGGWGVAGSQRKNSCRSVLTASGHSIMIMWLPSSRTFRKPIKRIWQEMKSKNRRKILESSATHCHLIFCVKALARLKTSELWPTISVGGR